MNFEQFDTSSSEIKNKHKTNKQHQQMCLDKLERNFGFQCTKELLKINCGKEHYKVTANKKLSNRKNKRVRLYFYISKSL